VGSLVVCGKGRGIRIIVFLTKSPRFIVKRFSEVNSPALFVCFRKTVVNIRRGWIPLDVRLERCDRFFRLVLVEQLVANLIDDVLIHNISYSPISYR